MIRTQASSGFVRPSPWSQHSGRTSTSVMILCQMECIFASLLENSLASRVLGNN